VPVYTHTHTHTCTVWSIQPNCIAKRHFIGLLPKGSQRKQTAWDEKKNPKPDKKFTEIEETKGRNKRRRIWLCEMPVQCSVVTYTDSPP